MTTIMEAVKQALSYCSVKSYVKLMAAKRSVYSAQWFQI